MTDMSFAGNGRLHGGAGFRGRLWSGAFGLGNFHAVGLSTGPPAGQGIWKTSTQLGVRTLEVDQTVLVLYRIERRGEPRGSSKSHL